jgi:hypothetical protein
VKDRGKFTSFLARGCVMAGTSARGLTGVLQDNKKESIFRIVCCAEDNNRPEIFSYFLQSAPWLLVTTVSYESEPEYISLNLIHERANDREKKGIKTNIKTKAGRKTIMQN